MQQAQDCCSAPPRKLGEVLSALNHVSIACACVQASRRFYIDLLGFKEVRRPGSLTFDGAWCAQRLVVDRGADPADPRGSRALQLRRPCSSAAQRCPLANASPT